MGSKNFAGARRSLDDDVTVDELMEALGGDSRTTFISSGNGFTEKLIDADSNEPIEELIAPELLFPDETDHSD